MELNKAQETIKRFLAGESNVEEEKAIEHWYKRLMDSGNVDLSEQDLETVKSKIHNRLKANISTTMKPDRVYPFKRWIWAAASVVLVAVGLYLNNQNNKIVPGSDKAILTLANGTTIELSGEAPGHLVNQNGVSVKEAKGGWLQYLGESKDPELNTLTTPRGGQFRLMLPDGSRVWLNAETKIEYPTAFVGKTRKIKFTGEAFFEIKHDKEHPFLVEANGMNVSVLGTSFNVMAYPGERTISTTVATGLVGVSYQRHSELVPAGYQLLCQSGKAMISRTVDVEQELAWKDGLFRFNGMKLSAVIQQISRWYDVEFDVAADVPDEGLYGIMSRREDISHTIEILEAASNLDFKISGRKIIVTKVNKK